MHPTIRLAVIAALPATAVSAQTLTATRPGLMCTSADALAELTLPDGSSRAASNNARPGDDLAKQRGGCIDIPQGAQVTIQTARRNTTTALYDAHDGHGPHTYIIPNIDFTAAAQQAPRAGTPCIRSNSAITVTGTIHMRTLPPDPDMNRSSSWTYPVMTFDRPICVQDPEFGDVPNGTKTSVIFSGPHPPLREGQHVSLTGQLGPPDNGHQPPEQLMLFVPG